MVCVYTAGPTHMSCRGEDDLLCRTCTALGDDAAAPSVIDFNTSTEQTATAAHAAAAWASLALAEQRELRARSYSAHVIP